MAKADHLLIATEVPSTTSKEEYGWLGQVPGMREWLGDRVVQNVALHDYTIKNRDFELTIGVPRNAIKDDNYGVYAPLFQEMGRSTTAHPSQLCYPLLKAGFTSLCYDGQYFFDTDHPVLDESGAEVSVANTDGGNGAFWCLFDNTRALKPVIFQNRQKAVFEAKDNPDDENVWRRKEFEYGVDARYNAGFGFWQMAWGSRQPLTPENYEKARAALMAMKGDYGRPLGLTPGTLLVSPTLEGAGKRIVVNSKLAGGGDNEWAGTAELVSSPWLA
ncbi:Mu-like prophage major head subunit gpT family protein [Sphingomonas paucimobilis]|uniref:Mu-like prophage major head subunit gpT family protein n=1 Tax=Sphingomonas paucimobilis TaxID=13689 RepID=UPI0031E2D526